VLVFRRQALLFQALTGSLSSTAERPDVGRREEQSFSNIWEISATSLVALR
jgi:hypothetical protein